MAVTCIMISQSSDRRHCCRVEAKRQAEAPAPPSALLVSDSLIHLPSEVQTFLQSAHAESKSDPIAHPEGGPEADAVAEGKSGTDDDEHPPDEADPITHRVGGSEPVTDADEPLEVRDDVHPMVDPVSRPVDALELVADAEGKSGVEHNEHPMGEAGAISRPVGGSEAVVDAEKKSDVGYDIYQMSATETILDPVGATEPVTDSGGGSDAERDLRPMADLMSHPVDRLEPVADEEEKSDVDDDVHPFDETEVLFHPLGGAESVVDVEKKSVVLHAAGPARRFHRQRAASAPPDRSGRRRVGKTSSEILNALDHKEADLEVSPLQDAPRRRINRMALRALYLIGENVSTK